MAPKKRKRAPAKRLIPGAALAIVEAGKNTRFQPGQSGNPSGRPSYAELSRAYRARLADPLDPAKARALKLPIGATVAEGIAYVLAGAALDGDVNAARELCNRVEGQAPAFLGVALNARPKMEYTIRVIEEPPKFPVAPDKQKLLDYLLSVVQEEPDLQIARQVADLTRALRKKYATAKP